MEDVRRGHSQRTQITENSVIRMARESMDQPGREVPSPARRGGWWALWHPRKIAWVRMQADVAGIHPHLANLRIIHLTDLHFRTDWCRTYDRLIADINSTNPDLILFTGDFIDSKEDHRQAMPVVKRFFSQLKAPAGLFAILGNHDGYFVGPLLADMGITWLNNQRVVLKEGEAEIELIGLPGVEREDLSTDFIDAIPAKNPGSLRIVMSHYPDLFEAAAPLQPDLYLTGHTHGGQVCLPGGYPLLVHDTSPRWRTRDIHHIGNTWFVANRGIGFSTYRVRLFCPSEAIEIVIRPG